MMMKIGAWNVRGLSQTTRQDEVISLIREERLSMCAVLETHLRKKFVKSVGDNTFGNWNWLSNIGDCRSVCRIMVGWDSNVVGANLISHFDQAMHFEVNFVHDHRKQFVSFIYAKNKGCERKALWKNLVKHSNHVKGEPWVLVGDFNVALNIDDCSESTAAKDNDIEDFRTCVECLELDDISSKGMFYTWIQKRKDPGTGILKKLDRALGNGNFISTFDNCFAEFLPFVTSDHSPVILVYPLAKMSKPRSFRFVNFLADKDSFIPTVEKYWGMEVQGFRMFILAKRLKNMKRHLRNMNRSNGNVFSKVKMLRVELKRVQQSLDKDPNNCSLREEEIIYCKAYKEAVMDEESLLRQKTKIQWLKDGDHNTSYFHNLLKSKTSKCRIQVVCDEQGNKFYGDEVPGCFVSHFQNFLGMEDEVFPIEDYEDLFIKKLDPSVADSMVRTVTDAEIKEAMFSIDVDKTAGPDGYTSKFFKVAWSIVGSDVCDAVREFFSSGKLLGEFNANLISLIPKIQVPLKVSDFRPIACGNVVYKCISKVITNRIKEGLTSLIDSNQSAFIPGRQISDNILLAQEFMKGYSWKRTVSKCAFKVDIQKAYDTVNWDFLKTVLIRFGFHSSMVHWIMVCLTSASFSICVNGELHGFFKSKRGLRQGDPMSPYLFTIVMEVFNLMVKRQIRRDDRFRYHWGCKKLMLTHLCFADDLLLLCHGDEISACILRRALDEFTMCSGLYPSLPKSAAFFGSVSDVVKDRILMAMPFSIGQLPMKYLGIPLTGKRISNADCRVLIDKVKSRIQNWRNKTLSFAGRLQLVSSVLSSLHVYWASMFLLPVHVCDSIDKILKKFLWSSGDDGSGIASVAWKDVCKPKNQGGLGLKPLRLMNEALMTKHLWNVISKKDSLWVKWVYLYRIKDRNIWFNVSSEHGAWSWNQILELRDKIRAFVVYKLGNGRSCSMWFDKWHTNGPLCKLITHSFLSERGIDVNDKVADWIDANGWKWPLEWNTLFGEVLNVPVPVLLDDCDDKVLWINKKNKDVLFSVKEAWKALRVDSPKVIWHKHVWFSQCIPRHAFVLWMAMRGRLKTTDRISKWFNVSSTLCPLCKNVDESHSHLFFKCQFSKIVWDNLKLLCKLDDVSCIWAEIVSGISVRAANSSIWSVVQRLVFGAAVYFIWQERNIRIFQNDFRTDETVFKIIVDTVRHKLMGLKIKRSLDVEKVAKIWKISVKGIHNGVSMGQNGDANGVT